VTPGSGRSATQLVARHDIRRFAVAIGALAPEHHDVAAARALGHRDLLAPAFFFSTLGLNLGRVLPSDRLRADGLARDDELGMRVVAGESTVEWHRPIVAGDEVSVRERFAGERRRNGRSGPLALFEYVREYRIGDDLAVRETLVRIGRGDLNEGIDD
jgi:acyl dehydratase